VRFSDFSPHATGFSQMTIFPERRIYSAKILEGASPDAPNFFGSAGALPSRKVIYQSPIAIRCRFRLGRSLALPFFSSLVPRPSSRQKSALRFCVINRLKSAAWFGLGCIVNLKNSLLDCWDGEGRDGG
jgi:hypothetical protein